MFFTQIIRNRGMDVSVLEPSVGVVQLKSAIFVKMGIVDNFPKYTKKHAKRNVKKELKEESQSVARQMEGVRSSQWI